MAKPFIVLLTAVCLAAGCGGSSSPSGDTGILNLAITDAAYEDVAEVWVRFEGAGIKPQSGPEMVIEFDEPMTIDLATLQNGITHGLLDGEPVPAGRYNWIRLMVSAEDDGVMDSYAMLKDGREMELVIPSGSQSGLKLVSGFTVLADQSTHLVTDWVLSKALSYPPGRQGIMHLRPALRITDMALYGTLAGTVANALVTDSSCTNDLATDTGNAVYVYQGDVGDVQDINAGASTDPLVTAPVLQDSDGMYAFEIHFMPVGDYTVAFTCQASDDDAESLDGIGFSAVATMVTVRDGETTVIELPPPPE